MAACPSLKMGTLINLTLRREDDFIAKASRDPACARPRKARDPTGSQAVEGIAAIIVRSAYEGR
jgi:hypothetical protein